MKEYHKIQTVFKRDETKKGAIIEGDWSLPEFEYLASNQWVLTEKVDGTNIRVIFDNDRITFGGKTNNAQIPAFLVNRLQALFIPQIEIFKGLFPDGVCLYGEGYGDKIQKHGGSYSDTQDFVLFDVNVGGWWLERHNIEDIARRLGISVVPVIGTGTLYDMVEMTRNGFESTWGDFTAEGIVARPSCELKSRKGDRIITKIKYKDFR